MVIDRETFTEVAVHLKLASDAILKTARHLAVISEEEASRSGLDEHWSETLDGLMNINTELTIMEKLLRAIIEANREENAGPQQDSTH